MTSSRNSGSFGAVRDADTDNIDLTPFSESGLTASISTSSRGMEPEAAAVEVEAGIILIAHPENQRLGSRFRLSPGTTLEIGRSAAAGISLPEVLSISRTHARLRYFGHRVTIEDLGSTNGTYVNGRRIAGQSALQSGDRFQTAAVHFKFLHERDPEHAYHEAIYDLVMRDGLTEIYNKRKYDEELQREFARALRHRRPLSLIAFDIDEFKQVNDTWGHAAGDELLRQVAARVQRAARSADTVGRYGGDEFVVICEDLPSAAEALVVAERIRDEVARPAQIDGTEVHVGTSIGVALTAREDEGTGELIGRADAAMYEAKARGRGRIVVDAAPTPLGEG